MIDSLKGWAFVDSQDGRRWLGEVESVSYENTAVVHSGDTAKADGEHVIRIVKFKRAVEEWPYGTTAMLVAKQNALDPRKQEAVIHHEEMRAGVWAVPLKVGHMPPWTVYRPAGYCSLDDYPPYVHAELLQVLNGIAKQCEGIAAKALAVQQ